MYAMYAMLSCKYNYAWQKKGIVILFIDVICIKILIHVLNIHKHINVGLGCYT